MQVKDVAYARSGDKGDIVNVGVIAFDDAAFARLTRTLTPERIKSHFGDWVKGDVDVFPMPNLNAFNLLLHNALGQRRRPVGGNHLARRQQRAGVLDRLPTRGLHEEGIR